MLIVPFVLGWIAAARRDSFQGWVLALFAFWMTGYFAFFAASLWLKSRRKPRYLPAARTYSVIALVLGVITLALRPAIWSWGLAFAPILAIGLWFAYRRDERSLAAGAATVGAACLMPAVVYNPSLHGFLGHLGERDYHLIGAICLVTFGYFFGTVLYVKTMIRERGQVAYVVASVAWHAGCTLAVLVGRQWLQDAGFSAGTWTGLVAFFAVMTGRALAVPMAWPMRGRQLAAKTLGIGELGCTIVLVLLLMSALLG